MSEYRVYIDLVPEHLRDGLLLYIERGVQPGSFLTAVLENDLMEAVGRADEMSWAGLHELCTYLYNHAPSACHGSREKVKRWMQERRAAETEASA